MTICALGAHRDTRERRSPWKRYLQISRRFFLEMIYEGGRKAHHRVRRRRWNKCIGNPHGCRFVKIGSPWWRTRAGRQRRRLGGVSGGRWRAAGRENPSCVASRYIEGGGSGPLSVLISSSFWALPCFVLFCFGCRNRPIFWCPGPLRFFFWI